MVHSGLLRGQNSGFSTGFRLPLLRRHEGGEGRPVLRSSTAEGGGEEVFRKGCLQKIANARSSVACDRYVTPVRQLDENIETAAAIHA